MRRLNIIIRVCQIIIWSYLSKYDTLLRINIGPHNRSKALSHKTFRRFPYSGTLLILRNVLGKSNTRRQRPIGLTIRLLDVKRFPGRRRGSIHR